MSHHLSSKFHHRHHHYRRYHHYNAAAAEARRRDAGVHFDRGHEVLIGRKEGRKAAQKSQLLPPPPPLRERAQNEVWRLQLPRRSPTYETCYSQPSSFLSFLISRRRLMMVSTICSFQVAPIQADKERMLLHLVEEWVNHS